MAQTTASTADDLRQRYLPTPLRYPLPSGSKVVVIGAGVAGIATASLLAHQGYEVHCIEKLPQAGGRVGSWQVDGWRFDTGPSWYLMPEVVAHYFELLGRDISEHLDLVRLDPAYRLFHLTRQHPDNVGLDRFSDITEVEAASIPGNFAQLQEFFESREPGAGQRLVAYLENAQRAYELANEYFLYTTFQSIRPWLVRPVLGNLKWLLELLTTNLADYVNSQFQDPILQKVLQYTAVFLSAPPAKIPALYHILSHTDLAQGVFYPQGGFSAFIEVLVEIAQQEGVHFHFGEEVERITVAGNQVTGVRTKKQWYSADVVVSAADRHHTQLTLLGQSKRREDYWEKRKPGISAIVVLLGIRGKLPQLSHHNLLLSAKWEADFAQVWDLVGQKASASIYVCKTSATDPTAAGENDENIFFYIPTGCDPSLGTGSLYGEESPQVAAITQAAINQLSQVIGEDLSKRIVVQRTIGPADFVHRYNAWQGSALGLAHTLDQSAFFRGKQYDAQIAGLLYAGGTSNPGVGLPMCLISAENVLKFCVADTTAQRHSPKEHRCAAQ